MAKEQKCKTCGKPTKFYDPNMKYCYACFWKKEIKKKIGDW